MPGHYDDDRHRQPSKEDEDNDGYSNTLDLEDPLDPMIDDSVSKRAERMLKKVNRYECRVSSQPVWCCCK